MLKGWIEHGDIERFRASGLFDEKWYLEAYPDVAMTGIDPAEHYLWIGWRLNRRPSANAAPGMLADVNGKQMAPAGEPALGWDADVFHDKGSWSPQPVNNFWPSQQMRDFFLSQHSELAFSSHWYLMSVMAAWRDDQAGFVNGSLELHFIMERLRELAAARSEREAAMPNSFELDASVIIPVYNNVLDTLLCITSVLENGGHRNFEIIVADDGSNDCTEHLVSQIGGNVIYFRQSQNVGFLKNCNTSVDHCRGRYIVLLNNDTLVLPDWLDALLAPFVHDQTVGLCGSKLINWDGTLQEAGGIFWADGSAWNYGRGHDASAPEFNYVKDVDYCSGASIALPRQLWDELHGFDELYLPAYCEDADLAFRVRAAGYRSIYTPFSAVIHHEGRSHGRDLSSGIKAHQITNQAKLFERWEDTLRYEHYPNGVNVLRARDRSREKKHVLIVDHYIPQWDKDAGSRSMFHIIKSMLALGWQVTFWPDNLFYDALYARTLQEMGVEVVSGPSFKNGFENYCKERADLYDVMLLSRPHIACLYIDTIRNHTNSRLYYYGHDLHFLRMESMRNLNLPDAPTDAEIERMRVQELALCSRSDLVLYPGVEEATTVSKLITPDVMCRNIPVYCFEPDELDQASVQITLRAQHTGRHELLFVGGFSHTPNVDGIVWFVEEVLPLIRGRLDFRLRIVGSNPCTKIYDLAAADVAVLGFVTDEHLLQLYGETDIVVAPLRFGAGVKGKVVEAAARGVPVITTDIGAQGLEIIEPYLFIGNSTGEFADALIDASDRQQASQAARLALDGVRREFSQANICSVLTAGLGLKIG